MKLLLLLAGGLLCFASTIPAHAGIVISLVGPSGDVEVPSSGIVDLQYEVFVAADAGTQDTKGYTIPVDITPPDGQGLPQGISTTNIRETNSPYLQLPSGSNDAIGSAGDFSFTDGNFVGAVTLDTNAVSLFEFTLSIDNTAVPGSSFEVSIPSNNLFSYTDGNDNEIAPILPSSLRVNPVAVPEPGSVALFLVVAVFFTRCTMSRHRVTGGIIPVSAPQ